jgi:hypothetical protein
MNPTYAYAHGALVKMAEHNVDPGAFVQAAINTQDPLALKVAHAIVEYEKVAGIGAKAKGLAHRASNAITGGGGGIGGLAPAAAGKADDLAMGMAGVGEQMRLPQGVTDAMINNPQLTAALGLGVPTAGLAGAGLYGAGDADTLQNQAANLSNQYLGTDFGTQSRAGALFG